TMFSVALLLLLACEQLTQPASVTVQPGQRLTITCQVSYSVSDYATAWIRQPAGKGLEWIIFGGVGWTTRIKDSLKNKFSIDLDSSRNTVTLNGQNVQSEDTAVSPVYFPVFFPLAPLSIALFPSCSHVLLPFVVSPVGPPHLFLVLSSVSVYLVSVFPSLLVWSLFLSASFCVHAPVLVPAPVCSMFPHGMCFWIWVLPFDLNFVLFGLYFVLPFLVATLPCFLLILCLLTTFN
uniref:Immunoglobulin V-set domain-containing protein n=1 Tax=Sparus aurata TaxID=8175 RepID=A0A671WQM4_SPAAU